MKKKKEETRHDYERVQFHLERRFFRVETSRDVKFPLSITWTSVHCRRRDRVCTAAFPVGAIPRKLSTTGIHGTLPGKITELVYSRRGDNSLQERVVSCLNLCVQKPIIKNIFSGNLGQFRVWTFDGFTFTVSLWLKRRFKYFISRGSSNEYYYLNVGTERAANYSETS